MRIQQQNPKRGDWKDHLKTGSFRVVSKDDPWFVIIESNGIDYKTGDPTTFRVFLTRNEIAALNAFLAA
jgi:hypothetical protein